MIYFIQAGSGNAVKIGITDNLPLRCEHLSAYAGRIQLLGLMPGNRVDEQALHRRFRTWRSRKYSPMREWYRNNTELSDYISTSTSTDLSRFGLSDQQIQHLTARYIDRRRSWGYFKSNVKALLLQKSVDIGEAITTRQAARSIGLSHERFIAVYLEEVYSVDATTAGKLMAYFNCKLSDLVEVVEVLEAVPEQ